MEHSTRLYNSILCGIICETVGAQYENTPLGDPKLKVPPLPNKYYTDDTDMTLMLMKFFMENPDLKTLKTEMIHQHYGKHFDPRRGYSQRTRDLLYNLRNVGTVEPSPSKTNGCLMRSSALVPMSYKVESDIELIEVIKRCVYLTHNHEEAFYTVYLYIKTMQYLMFMNVELPHQIDVLIAYLKGLYAPENSKCAQLSLLLYLVKDETIDLAGFNKAMWGEDYVFHINAFECFVTALFLFLRNVGDPMRAFQECIEFGGDVDTVGKVLGDMLGIVYGLDWMPEEWKKIENHDHIESLIKTFLKNITVK